MNNTINNRLKALEGVKRPDPGDHEYKKVITWGADDRIITSYYKDGVEITAGQYHREAPKDPTDKPLNIKWVEVEGNHDPDN